MRFQTKYRITLMHTDNVLTNFKHCRDQQVGISVHTFLHLIAGDNKPTIFQQYFNCSN